MSDFLLQKSYKLLLESKNIKKPKKSEKLKLKKKKDCLNLKEIVEKEFQVNIIKNLNKLEQLSKISCVNVSEKVLPGENKEIEKDTDKKKEEEPTLFTEKDFEDFEKEYFDS